METYLAFAPAGYRSFRQAMPLWLKQKLHLPRELSRGLLGGIAVATSLPIITSRTRPARSFLRRLTRRPFSRSTELANGRRACFGTGSGNQIELTDEIRFPHSLGFALLGVHLLHRLSRQQRRIQGDGAGTLRQADLQDTILEHLMDLKEDGSFRMDMSYFNYCQGLTMTSKKFHELFGGPPRSRNREMTQREMDLAASVQAVTEEIMLRMARHVHRKTGMKNLVLAGGVALNCVGNGRLLREGPFENIWIQPAAGDAGGALGTALFIWHQLLEKPRRPTGQGSPERFVSRSAILRRRNPRHTQAAPCSRPDLCIPTKNSARRSAELIAQEKVVGWFQGRMEFGPRALGARSILGDARSPKMQSPMNLKIKFRESFRPFAPIVLREHVDRYFRDASRRGQPLHAVGCARVGSDSHANSIPTDDQAFGIDKLHFSRSTDSRCHSRRLFCPRADD